MSFILALIALLLVGALDGHMSSLVAMSLLYVLGLLSVYSINNSEVRKQAGKVLGIVFPVYVLSAFIASQSFLNGQYFYVSDSMKYIEVFKNVNIINWNDVLITLEKQYFYFEDNNGLYNSGLSLWSFVANHYFDGTSECYLTLFQTLFGVLASLEIYKIFTLYFEPRKAAKYTWVFAILSLFHLYSVLIIRDVVIAYFYLLGLRKIIGQPKLSDVFVLLFVMIVTMGIRLYTGLFFGAFVMFWAYKLVQDKKYKHFRLFLIPIITFGIVFVGSSLITAELMEGTEHEFEHYDELNTESGGFVSRLSNLPPGIRHFVVLFISQLPLTSLHRLEVSTSFSNVYISILTIVYPIFSFVLFYGMMYYCFIKGYFKRMSYNEKWILIIMLIFVALTLGTHMDVRRSMEAIPFFYLFYVFLAEKYNRGGSSNLNKTLITIGIIMTLAYTIIK